MARTDDLPSAAPMGPRGRPVDGVAPVLEYRRAATTEEPVRSWTAMFSMALGVWASFGLIFLGLWLGVAVGGVRPGRERWHLPFLTAIVLGLTIGAAASRFSRHRTLDDLCQGLVTGALTMVAILVALAAASSFAVK